MLLALDLDEDLIDVEGVAVTPVLWFQFLGVQRAEGDAPMADGFSTNGGAAFGKQVFYVSMADVESAAEPDRIADDVWRKSISLIGVHLPI
jgi:hypothetical protein